MNIVHACEKGKVMQSGLCTSAEAVFLLAGYNFVRGGIDAGYKIACKCLEKRFWGESA